MTASAAALRYNTAIFAIATGFSRVAGLLREFVAHIYFGTTLAASAFTVASQIPNLMTNLFAQAALSAAFVPVFTTCCSRARSGRRSGSQPAVLDRDARPGCDHGCSGWCWPACFCRCLSGHDFAGGAAAA